MDFFKNCDKLTSIDAMFTGNTAIQGINSNKDNNALKEFLPKNIQSAWLFLSGATAFGSGESSDYHNYIF